ncbi:hypothetical protein GX411_04845 [Candidatus Fermentibacteria bacterium]|nr:hypothetical protein [Candidatus Fermentibacteria bacterium]
MGRLGQAAAIRDAIPASSHRVLLPRRAAEHSRSLAAGSSRKCLSERSGRLLAGRVSPSGALAQ